MRSPDLTRIRNGINRNGIKNGRDDAALRYLSPGAFTILSPEENGVPPDPPRAPQPYRVAPKVKRNRNQAFAIIAEPISSRPISRSPSPSGRVSPFRGRGFNPKGSRFDVPPEKITGPPPEDIRTSPLIFGEKVTHAPPRKFRRKAGANLSPQYSKSLTNISKPPASPSRYGAYPKGSKLSPVSGRSPDARKSSSSKIPRSRSQPITRKPSPSTSKVASKPGSTATSPKKPVTASPSKNYKNVQAKVNSFNKTPVKDPARISEESEESTTTTSPEKAGPTRVNRMRNIRTKVAMYNSLSRGRGFANVAKQNLEKANAAAAAAKAATAAVTAAAAAASSTTTTQAVIENVSTPPPKELQRTDSKKELKQKKSKKKIIKLADLLPDANTVVATTTSTVTKPLKLEFEKVDSSESQEADETDKDGEIIKEKLTSTSISSAVNRMNDTILDSKTVMGTPISTSPAPTEKGKDEDKKSKGSALSKMSTKTTDTAAPTDGETHDRKSYFTTKVKVFATFLGTGQKHKSSRLTSASSIRSLVRGPSAKRKTSGASSKMSIGGLFKSTDDEKSLSSVDTGGGLPTIVDEKRDSDSEKQSIASHLPTIQDDNESRLSIDTKKSAAAKSRTSAKSKDPKAPSPTAAKDVKGSASQLASAAKRDDAGKNNNKDTMKPKTPDITSMRSKQATPDHSVGLGAAPIIPSSKSKVDLKADVGEEVQPLRINVHEKANDGEVQSGNLTLPISASNGVVSAQPGFFHRMGKSVLRSFKMKRSDTFSASSISYMSYTPSTDFRAPPPNADQGEKKPNICSRMVATCRSKISRKRKHDEIEDIKNKNDTEEKPSRFNCCKRKTNEDGTNTVPEKSSCFSCCRRSKKDDSTTEDEDGGTSCFSCCKRKKKTESAEPIHPDHKKSRQGCFSCCRRKKADDDRITVNVEEVDAEKRGCFDRLRCCRTNKVGDKNKGKWYTKSKKKDSWADRKESMLGPPKPKRTCRSFWRSLCCCCCKEEVEEDPLSRRISTLSKNKSLSPVMPQEDMRPKLDLSLVEHTSHMKGAIPVLPIYLAWFCCICNIFVPGSGTIFSGMFCLCIGKARFSQKDGAKQRIGAFIIDLIIGCGQAFTVFFCLVGWGWSIWWGVIMVKMAKRQQKLKMIEEAEKAEEQRSSQGIPTQQNHRGRDVERGLRPS